MPGRRRRRPYLWLISVVSLFVPRRFRAGWRREWEAELLHREEKRAKWRKRTNLDLFKHSAGSVRDALCLQRRRLEEDMFQDLRLGARLLVKHPGFTAITVLTLALGIGANVTIFSVVNSLLLRPLPYADPDRLIFLWSEAPRQNVREGTSAYANVADWREQSKSFEGVAVFDGATVTLTGAVEPERVQSVRASANLFSLLGAAPALGRTYTADEEREKTRVVVISHGLWQRRFGASPNVLRETLEIDGVSSQVIGVMPEQFRFPSENSQVWEPHTLVPGWEAQQAQRGTSFWNVVGRLKSSVSPAQAQFELDNIARQLEEAYPDANKNLGVRLVPFHLQITGGAVRSALWVLFGAVVFVLLIACTNVANMMLARGVAREREMAIRTALGAGRTRLVRQMLVESAVLILLAGAIGLLLAQFGVKLITDFGPPNIANLDAVEIDARVLIFTAAVSLLTGLAFGLVPAVKISQSHPGGALKGGRGTSGGIGGRRLRALFVVTEYGLAVLLLAGAGLLLRSFVRLQAVDPGFESAQVLSVQTAPARGATDDQLRFFYQQAIERAATLPGVESAGTIENFLISRNPDALITVENGATAESEPARVPLSQDVIGGKFFETLRVPLLGGRFFGEQDNRTSVPVTIVNETMARRFWPGEHALGKRFKLGPAQSSAPWLTIVGVVGDMRRQSLERQPIAQVFVPYAQDPQRGMTLLIRTKNAEPLTLAPGVRAEIHAIDKTVPVYFVSTLESNLARTAAQRRFQTWLLTLFSALALLLAAIGIYGVVNQSVASRTREIGTRLALGARPRDVLWLIVSRGAGLALCGIAVGLTAAYALTRILENLLFGVTATDPVTFIAAPLGLLFVALLACYLPARRATRIDPVIALRGD